MNRLIWLLAGFALLGFAACTPYYISSTFESQSAQHQTIAVLPFEMQFTGVQPERLTESDILELETAESRAFQISFHNELLRSTRSGRKALRVSIQDYHKTLRLLRHHDIDIRESWYMAPEELAALLEVDAVVRARIQKARYMSDLASYGIEVGMHVIRVLTQYWAGPWFPPISNRSKAVLADYSLYDGEEGTVLWSICFDRGADWRQPANEIIDEISRTAVRKFPYRL